MRFSRSFVSGFETSGDRGPSPSPFFGSQGAGVGGFWILSGIPDCSDFRSWKQIVIADSTCAPIPRRIHSCPVPEITANWSGNGSLASVNAYARPRDESHAISGTGD